MYSLSIKNSTDYRIIVYKESVISRQVVFSVTGLFSLASYFFMCTIMVCKCRFLGEVARGIAGFLMQALPPNEFSTEQV